jgi:signal peptidase I
MLFDQATIRFLKSAVEKDGFLELPAQGNSMFPLIQRGDVCRFIPCSPASLVKGDIVLFHMDQGQLVAHRFVETGLMDGVQQFLLKGDTNLGFDKPVNEAQLIGKLTTIQKKRHDVSADDFASIFWGKLILALPIISGILRKYLNWKNHNQDVWSSLWQKLNSF